MLLVFGGRPAKVWVRHEKSVRARPGMGLGAAGEPGAAVATRKGVADLLPSRGDRVAIDRQCAEFSLLAARGLRRSLGANSAGDPYGTRTRVFAVRGRRPGPLDEGAAGGRAGHMWARASLVKSVQLEPQEG